MSMDSKQIATKQLQRCIEHYRCNAWEWIDEAKLFMAKHGDGQMSPETRECIHVVTKLCKDILMLGVEHGEPLCALFESAIEQTVFRAAFRIHGNYAAVDACGCLAHELLVAKIHAIAAAETFV